MSKQISMLEAIKRIMLDNNGYASVSFLVQEMSKPQYYPDWEKLKGKTRRNSLRAAIYHNIEEFTRIGKGVYKLATFEKSFSVRDNPDVVRYDWEMIGERKINKTEKRQLITARVGQGEFRKKSLELWNRHCALTDCGIVRILRASHIKPWRDCENDGDRLNPNNSILLAPHADALFDCGLISFHDDGGLLKSAQLKNREIAALGLTAQKLRQMLNAEQKDYLNFHRENVFLRSGEA